VEVQTSKVTSLLPPGGLEEVYPGAGLTVHLYQRDNGLYLTGYIGKSEKPAWTYRFQDETSRRQFLSDMVEIGTKMRAGRKS
jgi:hypothetical protein